MLRNLRARLAERRIRRETARVHAAWRREACDPEALRIAALMVERAKRAVTV
ncbi:MAG TPA: hypothetical protein VFK04_13085 [Gemmatimonadaceae bacterium]|nr:hypothetical protein [Gemmatimonadaceae bacterium]